MNRSVAQSTTTVVTSPLPTVPEPPETVQVCEGPVGCAAIVTANAAPLAIGVGNTNEPPCEIATSSPPLFCSTSPAPERPDTVPLTENSVVAHRTWMLATGSAPAVPLPLPTVHICVGESGCVFTVTAYGSPWVTVVANVNSPSAETARSSPPLSTRTRPDPCNPVTCPLIVTWAVELSPQAASAASPMIQPYKQRMSGHHR